MSEIALTSWPLDNKEYTSEALGAAFAARSRGVLHATDFAATVNGDNTVTLSPGAACLHVTEFWGTFPYLLEKTTLTLDDADGRYPRWDAIALVYDKNLNEVRLEARAGTAAASPALPTLRRNDDYDEVFLYRVTRPQGATKISADSLVDLRQNTAYCGLMRDNIDAVDTRVMQASFDAFLSQIETELAQLHAGTATMTRAEYDPSGGGANVTVQPYTCTKTGSVYALTGTGAVGRCKIPAAWANGDTWTVNGRAVPAYCGADAADGDCIVEGRTLLFTYDGTRLDFNGGGGLSASKLAQATADEDSVLADKLFFARDKIVRRGRLRLSGTITAADIPAGKTGYSTDPHSKLVGTMPQRGAWSVTVPWGGSVVIPQGIHSGAGKVTATSPTRRDGWAATINPGGRVAIPEGYHNGSGYVAATAPTQRGAWSATINPGASVTVPEGYHNGGGKVLAKPLKTEAKQARRTVGYGDTYLTCSGTLVGVGAITTYDDAIESLEISGNTLIVHTKGWSNYFTIIATLIYY